MSQTLYTKCLHISHNPPSKNILQNCDFNNFVSQCKAKPTNQKQTNNLNIIALQNANQKSDKTIISKGIPLSVSTIDTMKTARRSSDIKSKQRETKVECSPAKTIIFQEHE